MASKIAQIAVEVGADIQPLQKAMGHAGKSVDRFAEKTSHASLLTVKNLRIAAAGAASLGVAFGTLAGKASKSAEELLNLSRISNAGVEDFQKWAYAAKSVGIEQDKLADILKDVNDRVGDFMATGGGPMKDFFENIAPKVGVTADQFARLSGPEALLLYVDSLEKAGVSQQKMTFYMEAISSDATAMVPLLRNAGAEITRLGEAAESAGVVVEAALVNRGAEIADKWRQYMNSMVGYTHQFALQAATMMDNAFGFTDSGKMEMVRGQLDDAATKRANLLSELDFEKERGARALGGGGQTEIDRLTVQIAETEAEMNAFNQALLDLQAAKNERAEALSGLLDGRSLIEGDAPAGVSPASGGGSGGGGGILRPTSDELFAMQERLAKAAELQDLWIEQENERYADQQAFIQEALEARQLTEEEAAEYRERLAKEHGDRLLAIERAANMARVQGFVGAADTILGAMASFGDRSTKVAKMAGAARALIATYLAANEAMAETPGGLGARLGAWAIVAAKGLAAVGAIQSVNAKSGSSSGSVSSGGGSTAAASATAATAAEQVNGTYVTINAPGFESILGSITERINEEIANGAVIKGINTG